MAPPRSPVLNSFCSFTEAQSRKELRDRVLKDYPKLNVLVNNAGTQRRLGAPSRDALLRH